MDLEELERLVDGGEIHTVIVAFTDMQGRLMGKRMVARVFLDQFETTNGSVEACDYLLSTNMEMHVLDGFRFSNWETGYGDLECRPDMTTLRRLPWLDGTVMVLGDTYDHGGKLIDVSPRTILRRQVDAAAELGYESMVGTELEFYLLEEAPGSAAERGWRELTPTSPYIIDYHLLATTRDEHVLARLRNEMLAAGLPVENSKGEAGRGQYELNLRYASALEMADNHVVYKNGAKEIASAEGRSLTFMAKYDFTEAGSSCHIHSSLWDTASGRSAMPSDDPHEMSDVFRWYLGGLLATAAEFSLCWAPFVNSYKRFQPESWAPTAIAWDTDNRTTGFRIVGTGQAMRVESRIPGADCNPYVAIAAMIAGGLHGVRNRIEPPAATKGNTYDADVPRIPSTLAEAIELWERSEVAKAAFGEAAHFHLLHHARQELDAFNRSVTDWELRRYFEQV